MGAMDDVGVLIIGGVAVYFLLKTCMLQQAVEKLQIPEISQMVGQLGQMVGATDCPAPSTGTGGGGGGGTTTPPTTGGGTPGGSISGGTGCPSGGETCDPQGRDTDCDNVTWDAYEATFCGSWSGDRLSIKMYGPRHSNAGDCCWCIGYVDEDGTMNIGGEGPHPGSNCDSSGQSGYVSGGSVGGSSNVCVKYTMQPGPTVIGYGLVGGQWKELVRRENTPCGCDETSSTKTGNQVSFRCDGSQSPTCATVVPLGAGGGTTTPAPTTTTGGGGSGNGNGNGNGGTTTPAPAPRTPPPTTGTPPSTAPKPGCPARCEPLRLSSPNTYQYCCNTAYTRIRSSLGVDKRKIRNYNDLRFRSVIPEQTPMIFR